MIQVGEACPDNKKRFESILRELTARSLLPKNPKVLDKK